jgi:predicted ATPase/DNA-binding CsgD family transcriptional regulator
MLAPALTPLIGRARELQSLTEALRRDRLVTIAGPGGIGKTRLALELVRASVRRLGDGVRIVDLTAILDAADVPAEVARALDVSSAGNEGAADAVTRFLASRELLLVLDNCEHVAADAAALASALLATCPSLRILATSREPLGVDGEVVFRLDPLEPDDARRLFLERARRREPRFAPDAATDAVIAQLCERLDRLPLAVELAASRMNALSPSEVLEGLERRLLALESTSRAAPSRQRTVRATADWSYHLLDPVEQRCFRALAVFVGGFDAAAAGAVVPDLSNDLLARLVDKSLVTVVDRPTRRTRYRLLETLRAYGLELLDGTGELDDARERHLAEYSARAGAPAAGWPTTRAQEIADELSADYENVRAALEWALARDPCEARRMLLATRDLFFFFGHADGMRFAERALAGCPAADRDRAEVLVTAGTLAMAAADADLARRSLHEALQLGTRLGDEELQGSARLFLGLTETLQGDADAAGAALEAARELFVRTGGRIGFARATAALGLTFLVGGEPARARVLIEEALAIDVAERDLWGQGQCHLYLGIIAEGTASGGDVARGHYRAAVECLRPLRAGPLLPVALVGLAGLLAEQDPARAVRLAAAAYELRARLGGTFPPFFRERVERGRATAEARAGADTPASWAAGRRLDVDGAIALALGTGDRSAPSALGLSRRELDVVRLVAAGLANKEVAARLHLSVRTVESHVRSALAKAGVANRTQLATWAHDRIQ